LTMSIWELCDYEQYSPTIHLLGYMGATLPCYFFLSVDVLNHQLLEIKVL